MADIRKMGITILGLFSSKRVGARGRDVFINHFISLVFVNNT